MNYDEPLLGEHRPVVQLEPFDIPLVRIYKRPHPEDWGGEALERVILTTNDVNGMVLV